MEITAIQCPKCGSTQKTEIKPERFRCESCGTEYVLDNGQDHAPGHTGTVVAPPVQKDISKLALVGIFVFCIVFLGIVFHFYSGRPRYHKGPYASGATQAATLPAYSWSWRESFLYRTADDQPILLSIGSRRDQGANGSGEEVSYAVFADAVKGKKITSVKLSSLTTETSIRIREFSNGEVYLITDNTTIYRIDKSNFTLSDVTKTLFSGEPVLSGGVARIEFLSYEKEDGFSLVTNDGKALNYFPVVHKVYGKDELWKAEQGFGTLLPGAVEKTGFAFCYFFTYGVEEPERRPQLIKYRYMDNGGGPKTGVGVLPKGVNDQNQKNPRVLSYTDFTPGRIYFSQAMLYYDNEYVLFACKPTAAVNALPPDVQCMNAKTGELLFTARLSEANNLSGAIRTKNGFSLLNYNSVNNISTEGKIIHLTQPKDYEF